MKTPLRRKLRDLDRLPRPAMILGALLFFARAAAAHDFWIEPSTFRPRAGERVTLSLRVGENFVGELVPRRNERIERFWSRSSAGDTNVAGLDGSTPAGWLSMNDGEGAVVSYRSRPSYVELDAAKFEQYLREEGLERVIAVRATSGRGSAPGREMFSRCAKSVLGTAATADVTRPTGLRYEIVPSETPAAWGKVFRGRVLFDGQPVDGALVVAMLRGDSPSKVSARSNSRGEFALPLPRRGVWLVKSVHMVPSSGSAADWESLWASLTFDSSP